MKRRRAVTGEGREVRRTKPGANAFSGFGESNKEARIADAIRALMKTC